MKKLVLILCLLSLTMPAAAQQGRTGFSGFSFLTPLQMSVGTDNNFLVDRSTPDQKLFVLSLPASVQTQAPDIRPKRFSDKVMLLKLPTIGFLNDSPRHEFTFSYQPEFEMFQRTHDQNSWNNSANVNFAYNVTRRFQMILADGYRSSKDPSRTLQNVFLLLPRSQYRENDLRTTAVFNQSEVTSYAVRYDHTLTKFGQADQFQRRVPDTIGSAVSFIGTHFLQRNHRLRGTYAIFSLKPIDTQKVGDATVDRKRIGFLKPAQSLTMEYRFTPIPGTVLEFSGGGVKNDNGTNYVFGGSVDKRIGEMWLGGGYSRALSFFSGTLPKLPNGINSNSFYEVAFVRFRGQPTRRTGLEITAVGSRGVAGTLLADTKMALARGRFDYRWTDRLVTFFQAESYQQNRNDYVNSALSRNRLFVGLEFSLASETEQRTSRFNRDSDNVALNEHARKRQAASPK